ncbi:hypothetical protein EVAR_38002_1 [Eumeta japonica]|uniref:Uncharacterized protein n=1 Tax=Eumeta variegata TaxID=151549 RepID=A0A4C1WWV1_EUMVA|nr:hypothetical protein EVAR_38002_1 [Eumeta japonica]
MLNSSDIRYVEEENGRDDSHSELPKLCIETPWAVATLSQGRRMSMRPSRREKMIITAGHGVGSGPPKLSLTERNATAKVVTSRLYFVTVLYLTRRTDPFPYCSQVDQVYHSNI